MAQHELKLESQWICQRQIKNPSAVTFAHLRFRQHVDIAARVTRRWPTGLINHIIFTSKSRVEGFIEYASKTCIPTKESTNRMSVAPVLERRRYIRKQFIRGHPGTPWNRRYSAKNISTWTMPGGIAVSNIGGELSSASACLAEPNTHQKSLWPYPTSCNWCTSTETKAKQCTTYEP